MSERDLLIDGYLKYGTISIDSAKITASNSIVYIPANLHLGPMTIKGSSIGQHFKIEVIQCNLSLLGNFKKLKATDIFNPYSSKNPNHEPDITFEFPLSRSDIEEIENKRKGTDVDLGLYVNFHLEILPHPSTKIEGKRMSAAHRNLKIFRSQWEEIILPAFGYPQKKANSILFRTWEFLRKNWARIIQLGIDIWSKLRP